MSGSVKQRFWRVLLGAAVGLLLLLVIAGLWVRQSYVAFLETPISVSSVGEALELRVRPGDSVRAVLGRLEARGVTSNDWRWRVLLWREPVTIQAGEYALSPGTRPRDLLGMLERGEVIQYRFTIVEGWNWWQLRDAILAEERLAVAAGQLERDRVMTAIGSEKADPEGWFLPETYAYTADDDGLDVLRRAHGAMVDALAVTWAARSEGLPLSSPEELLTLASIVEKESAVAAERPKIAGVFVRRLEQNWRLETDPTVIYGIGEHFDGNIRRRDLRADTPYNTYVHRGLPPTPIAMPGLDSLRAAAAPAAGSEMFFVADGQGGHVFSDTLAEHNVAVQAMLRRLRAERAAEAPETRTDG